MIRSTTNETDCPKNHNAVEPSPPIGIAQIAFDCEVIAEAMQV
jgi:hypothetical protein